MAKRTCEKPGCDQPHRAHGLCSTHYERERGRHRHREDRVLATRARNRAIAMLIKRHAQEFTDLLEVANAQVRLEDAELRAIAEAHDAEVTKSRQVIRLKRGPKPADEEPEDRAQFTAPPRCEQCENYHAAGHRCLHCGAKPSRAIIDDPRKLPILVPEGMTDERISAAIERGGSVIDDDEDDDDEDVHSIDEAS